MHLLIATFLHFITGADMINNSAHAVYCIMVKAMVTKGKYSSIAVMSVPSALRKMPETASMMLVTMLAIQLAMPSKIQSNIVLTPKK